MLFILNVIYFESQAPAQAVTSEERHAAEQIFLEFRRTKQPYNLCRYILGKSFAEVFC